VRGTVAAAALLLVTACGGSSSTAAGARSAAPSTPALTLTAALLSGSELPLPPQATQTQTTKTPPRASTAPTAACAQRLNDAAASGYAKNRAMATRNFPLGDAVGAITEVVIDFGDAPTVRRIIAESAPLLRACPTSQTTQDGHHIVTRVTAVTTTAGGYIERFTSTVDHEAPSAAEQVATACGRYFVLIVAFGPKVTDGMARELAVRAGDKVASTLHV